MSIAAPPTAPTDTEDRPGRGLIITGSVLIAVSILGGIVGLALVGSRFDLDGFRRDVVVMGDPYPTVPGTIEFSVDDPLDSSDDGVMAVGIAIEDRSVERPECTLADASGAPIAMTGAPYDPTLLSGPSDYTVISTARLAPGDYVASCSWLGEPSQAPMLTSFTVGRTLDNEDLDGLIGPVFGMFGVAMVAGLVFLIGLILLIVGLVRRSRSRRPPTQPYGGGWQNQWGPQPPPGSGPPHGYGPPQGYGPGASGAPNPWTMPPTQPPAGGTSDQPSWPTPPGQG